MICPDCQSEIHQTASYNQHAGHCDLIRYLLNAFQKEVIFQWRNTELTFEQILELIAAKPKSGAG